MEGTLKIFKQYRTFLKRYYLCSGFRLAAVCSASFFFLIFNSTADLVPFTVIHIHIMCSLLTHAQ